MARAYVNHEDESHPFSILVPPKTPVFHSSINVNVLIAPTPAPPDPEEVSWNNGNSFRRDLQKGYKRNYKPPVPHRSATFSIFKP